MGIDNESCYVEAGKVRNMKNFINVILFMVIVGIIGFFYRENIIGDYLQYGSILFTLSVIFIGFIIFMENRQPTQTLAWLIVLGAFPVVGFFFYLLFGRNFRKEKIFKKKFFLDQQKYKDLMGERNKELLRQADEAQEYRQVFTLAEQIGNTPISLTTETKVLTNGRETFNYIKEALLQAKHHIHMEYYIVRDDVLGREIKDILIDKAKSGVKIRFLYDAVGSWTLSKSYIKELRKWGIEAVAFGPVKLPFLNNKFNFRNHRKIIVVDGVVGFVGGLNIGDEYLGKDRNFGFWRDTHLMLKGQGVRSLQLIFMQDWYYMTNYNFLTEEYLATIQPVNEERYGGVQIIAGGPDNEHSTIKNIFFSMIVSAKKSVWIASPYFIPDEDIFSALKIAALSGIDVRLLVPSNPDKRIVFHASRSYYPDLLEAGVKVYEYREGFMHSKIVIVDGELASIGTSNMDMRSFHLNFEVNAFLYKTESVRTLVNDYLHDLLVSNELHIEIFKDRHFGMRMMESLFRLLSPML